ncbi:sulfotransferase family 2 domain-containing protein [Aliiglaciecola litoralis]|uniref:Sulfotransferase family protein n=1 Tax=Aliiglaciecola litoralis TaxID=582857 RepID=A0ABN1LJR8_9ALTE
MTKHKCVFIHIPKAAGTSILQTLNGKNTHIQRDHANVQTFIASNKALFEKSFTFTIVREPTDRVLSIYKYLKNGGNGRGDLKTADLINAKFKNINDFVMHYMSVDLLSNQLLFKPQYTFICDEHYNIKVDFVGRFESLEQDFAHICKVLNIHRKLKKVNTSKHTDQDLVLSDESKQKISQLYNKDFELFSYKKPV